MEVKPRQATRSVVSDRPCFEEVACFVDYHDLFPEGHPQARQPSVVGPPLLDAERATVLLSDGSMTSLTILADERADLEAGLGHVWRRVLAAMRQELDMKYAVTPTTPEQVKVYEGDALRLAGLVPLGVMCYQRCIDIQ